MANLKIARSGNEFNDFRLPVNVYIAAGAIAPVGGIVVINNAANIALTLKPENGQLYVFFCQDTGTGSTITLPSTWTWDGINDVATFGADGNILAVVFEQNRAVVLTNTGVVAFS